MKHAIALSAALILGAATIATPASAQSGNTAQMTGSNATGVQPDSKMSGKMSGSGPMKSKKMKSKKNRM